MSNYLNNYKRSKNLLTRLDWRLVLYVLVFLTFLLCTIKYYQSTGAPWWNFFVDFIRSYLK